MKKLIPFGLSLAVFGAFLLVFPFDLQATAFQQVIPETQRTTSHSIYKANVMALLGGDSSEEKTEVKPEEEGGSLLVPKETAGTKALGVVLDVLRQFKEQESSYTEKSSASSGFGLWLDRQIGKDSLQKRWRIIGQNILVVLVAGFLSSWALSLLLLPFRLRLSKCEASSLRDRVTAVLKMLVLRVFPVLLFGFVALLLLGQGAEDRIASEFVTAIVYSFVLLGMARVLIRMCFVPKTPTLRFLPLSSESALYLKKWLSAFAIVTVVGYMVALGATVVSVPKNVTVSWNNFIGFLIVSMAVVMIFQSRETVAKLIAKGVSKAKAAKNFFDGLRLLVSKVWHLLAIAYLVVGYVVTVIGSDFNFMSLQKGTFLTLFVVLLMRLGFFLIGKIKFLAAQPKKKNNSGIYKSVLKFLLIATVWLLSLLGVYASWGGDVLALLASAWGQRVLGSIFSITSTLLLVVAIYELLHFAIERQLNKEDEHGNIIEANQRARTILPMVHNIAIVLLAVIVGLVTLSEMGVNIAPLLAGAGVLGVAVGFGSQTLIKDFLTGLFIVIEDTIAVGDIVSLGDDAGVVESITIRTVRLRDVSGSLHIIPFSEITRIINMTKDFAYSVIELGVDYNTDLRKAMKVMEEVGADLRQDPELKDLILEDFEILGVETLGDFSITLRGRLKTIPGKQFSVRREYILRVSEAFAKNGIEIPFPIVTYIQKAL